MILKNKNVLLVFVGGNLGGAERQGLGLAKFLAKKNRCKVDLLFISSDTMSEEFKDVFEKSFINKTFFFGEPYIYLKKELSIKNLKRLKWSLQYLLKLRKGLINEQYDIIIPFQNTPSKIAYFLYKLLPSVKNTFWHQLGLDVLKYDVFESIAINNIPCVIGNAENCLEIFKKDYSLKNNRLNILPQYISLQKEERDKKEIKRMLGVPKGHVTFGMIAHFKSFKFHDLLLRVFYKVNQKHPNSHLVLMGNSQNDEGTLEIYNNLINTITEHKIQSKVTLLSNKDVIDVLNILDIGVLLSLIEGTPNVVMEYMLYGLPVICSNHPGCVALLDKSSFLVNNTENQIFEAMERLLTSQLLIQNESKRNLELIQNYNIENYVEKLELILSSSLK